MIDEFEETVSCPHCGGPLSSEKYQDPSVCDTCLSEIGACTQTLLFTQRVARDQVLETVRAWWSGVLMAWDLTDRAQVTDIRLRYFPFWKLSTHITGSVKGHRTESHEDSEIEVPMEESVDDDFVWTEAACDASEIGVYYLHNLGGETRVYDITTFTGHVSESTVPQVDAISDGIAALEYGVLKRSAIPTITAHEVHFSACEIALLIYPFWTVRYDYAGRTYFVTVDGVTGALVAGRAPGSLCWRVAAFVTATAVTLLAVPVWIYLMEAVLLGSSGYFSGLFGDAWWFALVLALLMIVGWGLVLDGFALARYGAEVSAGDLHGGYRFRYTSEHPPFKNTRAIGGVLLGFGLMVLGGYGYFNEGRWLGLVVAAAGLVVYMLSCVSVYNPAWELVGRIWARDTRTAEKG